MMATSSRASSSGNRSHSEEVDVFAQRILEEAASARSQEQEQEEQPADGDGSVVADVVTVDDNLGSYVVNSLQESLKSADELPNSQFLLESLTELLQDQIRLESALKAQALLQQIADEVFAPPKKPPLQSNLIMSNNSSSADYSAGGLSINRNAFSQQQPIISPLAAQTLLPGALLEEEEEDDDTESDKPNTDDETAFPPLGAATDATADSTSTGTTHGKHHHHHHHHGKHRSHHSHKNSSNSEEASELAAALFRPTTRSRQSSMDETSSSYGDANSNHRNNSVSSLSPNLQPMAIPEQHLPYTTTTTDLSSSLQLDPMLLQYSAEWLLNMNAAAEQPLSFDAAYAVTILSRGDVNVAQYILDQVLHHELPVCRHLLQDGKCYRADCTFSHDDIETHTCLFWLKARCSKGSECRFLHGFANKWLDQVPDELPQYYDYGAAMEQLMMDQEENHHEQLQSHYEPYGNGAYNNSGVNGGGTMNEYSEMNQPHHQQQQQQQQQQVPSYPLLSSSYNSTSSSTWIPSPPTSGGGVSFANVAAQGYNDRQSFADSNGSYSKNNNKSSSIQNAPDLPTVPIPQDLWNPHENRDASAFYIADPLERYYTVTSAVPHRNDVIDLHFQSLQTFATVLDVVLPEKLQQLRSVWIVTGTGHHVGSRTHQKGGGTLERSVLDYLVENYVPPEYSVRRGRDRNGQGGAVLVEARSEAMR